MTRISVAVDVGNFAIKARFFRSQADQAVPAGDPVHVCFQLSDWQAAFIRWYEHQISRVAATEITSLQWRVASVNPPPTRLLKAWVEENSSTPAGSLEAAADGPTAGPPHQWREFSFRDVPLKLDVRHPERIGIDRLIAAWAAWQGQVESTDPSGAARWSIAKGKRARRRSVIVADAGSALTVDLVDAQGAFRGGAILPGRYMQLKSLGLGAFALPDLTQNPEMSFGVGIGSGTLECPGRDTQTAIQLGVLAGMVGAIGHLRTAYRRVAGEVPELILTGGDAPMLVPLLDQQALWVPHLLIDGLACL